MPHDRAFAFFEGTCRRGIYDNMSTTVEQHVLRDTVRKIVRSGASAFSYEREIQPLPKLGRWKAELDRLLASNASKSRTADADAGL